ncbi:MAG: response regulator transcription factor [Pseudomonadota bacterium]
MKRRIAYVEDDRATREQYSCLLRQQGFQVTTYSDKEQAIQGIQRDLPDLVLLDVTHLDDRDAGYRICAKIRQASSETPIIFLTNRQTDIDRISGFRLGADDYISKQVSAEFLLVRIDALFHRIDALRKPRFRDERTIEYSKLVIDNLRSTISWQGRPVELPLTHVWIVRELHRNEGRVCTTRQLMQAANVVVEPNTIAVYVKAIRRAFQNIDEDFSCIRTERGRGYRWLEC